MVKEFNENNLPYYAILSHTWEEGEVSFQDLQKAESRGQAGFSKLSQCCRLAQSEGWEYVWIDTCCIDKTSSAELSEAINSMYRWYEEAQVCYVYLFDLSIYNDEYSIQVFTDSKWFTRGWTLQELLAPRSVVFYDRNWIEFGSREGLVEKLLSATGISEHNLRHPRDASIAARMSWASHRKTTRIEDIAYCLLGLFDVNMPLLYGEGKKAFKRLQQEIIASSSDESVFAWKNQDLSLSGMFAQSPADFAQSGTIISTDPLKMDRAPYTITNHGLAFDVPEKYTMELIDSADDQNSDFRRFIVPLACAGERNPDQPIVVTLTYWSGQGWVRGDADKLRYLDSYMRPIISKPQTYYIKDVSISNRAKHVPSCASVIQLPILLTLGPGAHPVFRKVRLLNSFDRPLDDYLEDLGDNTFAIASGPSGREIWTVSLQGDQGITLLYLKSFDAHQHEKLSFCLSVFKHQEKLRPDSLSKWMEIGSGVSEPFGNGRYLWVSLKWGFRPTDQNNRYYSKKVGTKCWILNVDVNQFDRLSVLKKTGRRPTRRQPRLDV